MDFSKLSESQLGEFFRFYGYEIPTENKIQYAKAAFLDVLNKNFPLAVQDLLIASLYQGPQDQTYTQDEIMNLTPDVVLMFDQIIGFGARFNDLDTNRERIYQILKFLGLIEGEEEYSELEYLPAEILINVVSSMSIKEINKICRSSKLLNQKLCQNDIFWQQRYLQDFGSGKLTQQYRIWKELYEHQLEWKNKYINEFGSGELEPEFGLNTWEKLYYYKKNPSQEFTYVIGEDLEGMKKFQNILHEEQGEITFEEVMNKPLYLTTDQNGLIHIQFYETLPWQTYQTEQLQNNLDLVEAVIQFFDTPISEEDFNKMLNVEDSLVDESQRYLVQQSRLKYKDLNFGNHIYFEGLIEARRNNRQLAHGYYQSMYGS